MITSRAPARCYYLAIYHRSPLATAPARRSAHGGELAASRHEPGRRVGLETYRKLSPNNYGVMRWRGCQPEILALALPCDRHDPLWAGGALRFNTSDPDIATIVRRIERKTIDLQPEFQRGEVWSPAKKQRLIDTILRRWHVPPVHLVAKGGGKFDVLDGQQRLTAIRDFVRGAFTVDGSIKPVDESILAISGQRYAQLPDEVRDEFDAFAIRVFALDDYLPDEPHELFFRLNQPTSLTEAEKRNAFIGGPRNQVKKLVDWAVEYGMSAPRIGFSNARMAYDDLLARFLITLEQRTLQEKVTAQKITNRYRRTDPFSVEVIEAAQVSLQYLLGLTSLDKSAEQLKPNKATIHTWLCMAAKLHVSHELDSMGAVLARTIEMIERSRSTRHFSQTGKLERPLMVFHDRATSRVADVSSVVLRDLTGWMLLTFESAQQLASPDFLHRAARAWHLVGGPTDDTERTLYEYATTENWGGPSWL